MRNKDVMGGSFTVKNPVDFVLVLGILLFFPRVFQFLVIAAFLYGIFTSVFLFIGLTVIAITVKSLLQHFSKKVLYRLRLVFVVSIILEIIFTFTHWPMLLYA